MSRPEWNPGDGTMTVVTPPVRREFIYDRINQALLEAGITTSDTFSDFANYLGYGSTGPAQVPPPWLDGDSSNTVASSALRTDFIFDRLNTLLIGASITDQDSFNALAAYLGYGSGGGSSGPIVPLLRRPTDWQPGVPGGIPNRTTIFATHAAGTAEATIQASLNSCPSGEVVKLGAGTFTVTAPLFVPSGVTLRGNGMGSTLITRNTPGNPGAIVAIGTGAPYGAAALSSDAVKDQNVIALDGATAPFDLAQFTVGALVVTSQQNSVATEDINENDGCPWCGVAFNQHRLLSQMNRISARNGLNVTLERAQYMTFPVSLSAFAHQINNPIVQAGIEDLSVQTLHAASTSGGSIEIHGADRCWVKNVQVKNFTKSGIWLTFTFQCSVVDCFVDTPQSTASSDGYGIHAYGPNSDMLIQNNIILAARHSIVHEGGGSGNVIAYNYSRDCQTTESPGWVHNDLITHGAHPFFNLYEGNQVHKWSEDEVHGSAGYNTGFRQYVTGGTEPGQGYVYNQGFWCVAFEPSNNYMNAVGCVLGDAGILALPGHALQYQSGGAEGFIYRMGYYSEGSTVQTDTKPGATAYLHGNWNVVENSVSWDWTNTNHTIPNSLYLAGKPSWFDDYGATPFPPIGSDLSPRVNQIPAVKRWLLGMP